jgi:hypothetical protein
LAMHLGHDFVDAWLGSFNSFHHLKIPPACK